MEQHDESRYSAILLVESSVNAFRLVLEMLLLDPVPNNVILFQLFAAANALQVGHIVPLIAENVDLTYIASVSVVALQLAYIGLYEYFATLVTLSLLLYQSTTAERIATLFVVIFAFSQLHVLDRRAQLLRCLAFVSLFSATYATTLTNARYTAVLGLELASWASECHMLPWKIEPAYRILTKEVRFFIAFVIGVHILNGCAEEQLLLRPVGRGFLSHSVRGLSVIKDRAYVRYSATPMGVLLAHLEGLSIVPFRILRENKVDQAHHGKTFSVYIFGSLCVATIDAGEGAWSECHEYVSLVAATRFPFRRILLGLMLQFL